MLLLVEQSFKTRHEAVFSRLRSDILTGRLQPGSKLPFSELCEHYDVSVGVLREALSRLLEQGLVRSAPQQGYFVTAISRSDLVHLTTARREIETLTLRLAIADGDTTWESEVLAAHHRLAQCPVTADDDPDRVSEEWASRHRVFHETLLIGCGNPWLTDIAADLRASAELYRRWSIPKGHERDRDIVGEHRAIMDATLARDAELASALLARHITLTTELLLETGLVDDGG
jgi:DNA-binding GntR family transcriptional regulator